MLGQLSFDRSKWELSASVNASAAVLTALVVVAVLVIRVGAWRSVRTLELDAAEMGVGNGKITLKPNLADRQVAYAIWVELSTRKIGLPIDVDHDVIEEIYDSWYEFFAVTRDLIKTIPVSKVRQKDTRQIVDLSIRVLNDGLRPHLTKWQARFRHWYERQSKTKEWETDEPQKIQRNFGQFDELSADMLAVNKRLMAYRRAMDSIVYGV
jgi:hypothetical protein